MSGTPQMQSVAAAIKARLQECLTPTALVVLDESRAHEGHAGANGTGFGTHFHVRIQAPIFGPLTRVARHRLVYEALSDFLAQGVHAIAIEASP